MEVTLYSIVVPVYKTTSSLIELANRVDSVFSNLKNCDYELIFINDSPFYQKSVRVLDQIALKNSKIIIIELMKNFGQQAATLCGIKQAKGDYIITMDDDLQQAPEDIPKLMKKQNHDIVIGSFRTKKHNLFKKTTSKMKGYFDHILLGKPKKIKLTPFRMINSKVANYMFKRKTPYPFIPALLFAVSDDVVNVEVSHFQRVDGKSNYTFFKMLKVFSNLMINNSSFLLRLIGYMGMFIALLSILISITVLYKKIFWMYIIPGWSSTILTLLFFGGMILLTLGIIGEYLIRIIATTEERPVYFVRSLKQFKENE